ncbi:MAG: SET domain-containing protein-lysine N-methyltransferase [Chthoniobacterales bacterium]
MKERANTGNALVVKASGINGRGCFAAEKLRARRKIGEFLGEKISNREAARRVQRGGMVMICEVGEGWSIDASRGGNATAYINHSCAPNCFSRITHGHLLFFALRDICVGEELTLDYTPSQHPGLPCNCGAAKCHGIMR